MKLTAAGFALLAALLPLAGCGGDSAADKAYGGLSSQDRTAIRGFVRQAKRWPPTFGRLVKAESGRNVRGMRTATDQLGRIANNLQDAVFDIDNEKLQRDFDADAEGYVRVAAALDSYVAYYEDDSTGADSSVETQLNEQVQDAALDLQRADRKVARRILQATPEDERPALRRQIREAERLARQQASGE